MAEHQKPDEELARKVAKETVNEVLTALGIDVKNVHETQKDFAFNRKQRIVSEQVTTWTRRAIYMAAIGGVISLLVTGAGEALKKLF